MSARRGLKDIGPHEELVRVSDMAFDLAAEAGWKAPYIQKVYGGKYMRRWLSRGYEAIRTSTAVSAGLRITVEGHLCIALARLLPSAQRLDALSRLMGDDAVAAMMQQSANNREPLAWDESGG